MPRKVFVAGEILTAADVNTNLMDQSVMVFDDATARTTAIPTPVEGMTTYLKDTDLVEVFDGSDFVPVAIEPDPPAILQVVSETFSTETSTSSQTFQPTGLTATITPSSTSSKVLILATNGLATQSQSTGVQVTIFRGTTAGTNLGDGTVGFGRTYNGGSSIFVIAHISFLDSPSTASAQLYTMAFKGAGSGTVSAQKNDALATMTLIEVAG